MGRRPLRIERVGRMAYGPMLELQNTRHAEVRDRYRDDTLFLLEHEPVVTLGRNSSTDHVLLSEQMLEARSVELYETGRGGDVTYHGPGQIVGYPVINLQEGERDIRRYVTRLEEVLICTAADFGVEAERVEGLRGIWVGDDKLAAIGVRVARWTTLHGFAINVSTELRDFEMIVPCGLRDRGVTSLAKLLGEAPPLRDVEDRLAHHAGVQLNRVVYEASAQASTLDRAS